MCKLRVFILFCVRTFGVCVVWFMCCWCVIAVCVCCFGPFCLLYKCWSVLVCVCVCSAYGVLLMCLLCVFASLVECLLL